MFRQDNIVVNGIKMAALSLGNENECGQEVSDVSIQKLLAFWINQQIMKCLLKYIKKESTH